MLVRSAVGSDGAEILFSTQGQGPALLFLPCWLTHLDHQRDSPAWGPWLDFLSQRYTLIRHDPRGSGVSDRAAARPGLDVWVDDAACILDHLGLAQVPVAGICQGGAVAVALAARRPDLVGRLVLHGAVARGAGAGGGAGAMAQGWGDPDSPALAAFARRMQPEGGPPDLAGWARLQAMAASAGQAAALAQVVAALDVTEEAARIACPTLVLHGARDRVAPVAAGRALAAAIPGARWVELDTANHFPRADEPAWAACIAAMADLLPGPPAQDGPFAGLSAREREVLEVLARGADNAVIASELTIGEKTVRNHVSALLGKLGFGCRDSTIRAARAAGYGAARLRP